MYLGEIPFDEYMLLSNREKTATVYKYPQAKSSKAIFNLSNTLLHQNFDKPNPGAIQFFFDRSVNMI
jgi:MinD-like ATPase involved in chromosome partitioning or flagellar assembly